ncbi:MAG: hypothetical protein JJT76_02170 [Clostridiaceae bacterium]|nr:hypothetical protein [Clostridiaceae bacterium]
MDLFGLIIIVIVLIYMGKGSQNKVDVDRRWMNAIFIQCMVVFFGGIFVLMFIIYKLVTTQ